MRINRLLLTVALLISSCLLFVTNCLGASSDSITITTYYPSPYGSYNEMSVASRMAIGNVDGSADGLVNSSDMAVDSSGNPIAGSLTVADRLGIGTITPKSKLSVDILDSATTFAANSTQVGLRLDNIDPTTDNWTLIQFDSSDVVAAAIGAQYKDHSKAYADIVFGTRGSSGGWGERMRITSRGDVGIGTASPRTFQDARAFNLDVVDNIITDDVYLANPRVGSPKWASQVSGNFSTVCVPGIAGAFWPACFRVNITTGVVVCKQATNWAKSTWQTKASPFPTAAVSGGPFMLTCTFGAPGGEYPWCCRMDTSTGTSVCRAANGWDLASWVDLTSNPF